MEPFDLLLKSTKRRIMQIEREIEIIQLQLEIYSQTEQQKKNVLLLEYNISAILHRYYVDYYSKLKSIYEPKCPMAAVILKHMAVFTTIHSSSLIEKIIDHQRALQMLLISHNSQIKNEEKSVEEILKSVSMLFPYKIIISLLDNKNFMELLLKTSLKFIDSADALQYNQIVYLKMYRESLKVIFKKLKKLYNLDEYIIITISEVLLNFFVMEKVENGYMNDIDQFYFNQHSEILIEKGISAFGLTPNHFEKSAFNENCEENPKNEKEIKDYENNENENIQNNNTISNNEKIESNHLEKASKQIHKKKMCFDNKKMFEMEKYKSFFEKNNEIQTKQFEKLDNFKGISFLALEFMKIESQISISMICMKIWRCVDWLYETLSQDIYGDIHIGADESFLFFIIIVCFARIRRFPQIVHSIEKLVIEEFRFSSKIDYFVSQMRAACDFINTYDKYESPQNIYLSPYRFSYYKNNVQTMFDYIEIKKMKGLVIYARFTSDEKYQRYNDKAIIYYTGKENDVVALYAYRFENIDKINIDANNCIDYNHQNLLNDIIHDQINQNVTNSNNSHFSNNTFVVITPFGKIRMLKSCECSKNLLIVNNKSYEESKESIEIMSNLMVLLPEKVSCPQTEPLTKLLISYRRAWCMNHIQLSDINSEEKIKKEIYQHMKKIQQSLYNKGLIKQESSVTGVVNKETIDGVMQKFTFKNGDFFINSSIYQKILQI